MKTKIYLIIMTVLFFSGSLFSQNENEVVDGRIKLKDFSDTKVTLQYELPAGNFPNIPYQVTFNVKTTSEEFKVLVGLSGDHGDNVRPGDNLTLTWNFTEEGFVKSDVKDSEMTITGKRSVPPLNTSPSPITTSQGKQKKIKLPSVVVPSSIIAVGAGIFSFGISQELKAKDDYAFYKENVLAGSLVDNITITDELRTQYLDDAKSKRKQGITAMTIGGLASAAGAYLLIKKLEERNEVKKGFSFQPDIRIQNNTSTSVGGKVVFTF